MDAITTAAGASALLRIYDGTRPATAGTATTLLAELTCNATFAAAASGGVLTLNSITQDASANANGTATWFRVVKSDGTTFVMDGNAGTSGSDLNLTTTTIATGQPVSISSFVLTEGNP
jgi:archaellin